MRSRSNSRGATRTIKSASPFQLQVAMEGTNRLPLIGHNSLGLTQSNMNGFSLGANLNGVSGNVQSTNGTTPASTNTTPVSSEHNLQPQAWRKCVAIGVCSQQGRRPYQEDDYSIHLDLGTQSSALPTCTAQRFASLPQTHFFGLFDGHAGHRCSQYLSANLATHFLETEDFCDNLPQALRRSYYKANDHFLQIADRLKVHDGSTGLCVVIRGSRLVVANVGDCRAVVVSNGKALQMTTDHKPTSIEEQRRITSLGGQVVNCMGVARVNRVLAVSRAFGDRTLRAVIRPDADLVQRDIAPDDDFLVMASDGLWDVLNNRDVADVCYSPFLQRRATAIAEELVTMSLARGSMDNVTCICVNLRELREYSAVSSVQTPTVTGVPLTPTPPPYFTNRLGEASPTGANIQSALFPRKDLSIPTSVDNTVSEQSERDDSQLIRPRSNNCIQENGDINGVGAGVRPQSLSVINPSDLPSSADVESATHAVLLQARAAGVGSTGIVVPPSNARKPFVKATSTNTIPAIFASSPAGHVAPADLMPRLIEKKNETRSAANDSLNLTVAVSRAPAIPSRQLRSGATQMSTQQNTRVMPNRPLSNYGSSVSSRQNAASASFRAAMQASAANHGRSL